MANSPRGFYDELLPMRAVKLTTANTETDGTGDLSLLVDGTAGKITVIDHIIVQCLGISAAQTVNLFLTSANEATPNTSANTFLLRQFEIENIVPSTVQPCFRVELSLHDIGETPIIIAPSYSLRVAQSSTQDTAVYVSGGLIASV